MGVTTLRIKYKDISIEIIWNKSILILYYFIRCIVCSGVSALCCVNSLMRSGANTDSRVDRILLQKTTSRYLRQSIFCDY